MRGAPRQACYRPKRPAPGLIWPRKASFPTQKRKTQPHAQLGARHRHHRGVFARSARIAILEGHLAGDRRRAACMAGCPAMRTNGALQSPTERICARRGGKTAFRNASVGLFCPRAKCAGRPSRKCRMNHSGILAPMPFTAWEGPFAPDAQDEVRRTLESGRIVFFPELAFAIEPHEADLLDPQMSGARRKNVSFDPQTGGIGNAALDARDVKRLKELMMRFADHATRFVQDLLPGYADALERGRASFRPVEIAGRDYSPRHDDRRLHVDAFPSRPMRGRRILRLFSNVATDGAARRWQAGEPFPDFARRFVGRIGMPLPGSAWLLALCGITKGRRSAYDHVMLQLHDRAKLDADYQRNAPKFDLAFPAGSTWLCFTDQALHAALSGRAALEQTFYLPVAAMSEPATSPLRVLEKLMGRSLI